MILVSVFYDLFLSTCTTTTMITINATQSVPRIFVYFLSADTALCPYLLRGLFLYSPYQSSVPPSHPLLLGTVCFVFSSIA